MIYLVYCSCFDPRIIPDDQDDPKYTPKADCGICKGTGYVPANFAQRREYWQEVSGQYRSSSPKRSLVVTIKQ